jgi:hypothetical protein
MEFVPVWRVTQLSIEPVLDFPHNSRRILIPADFPQI